jgi:hypothetical protein
MKGSAATLYEFYRFVCAVLFSSEYTAHQKLLLLGVRVHADHDNLGNAFPSYKTLAQIASVKDPRTVQKELTPLVAQDGILTRQDRPGRTPVYGIVSPKVQMLIEAYDEVARKQRERKQPPTQHVPPTSHVPPTCHEGGSEADPPHGVRGVMREPPSCHVGRPEEEKEKGFAKSEHADASMQEVAESERVSLRGGVLTLCPELRAIWLPKFGNDAESLDFALTEAVAYIQPNGLKSLEVQVSAQLTRRAREVRERQQRYEARAAAHKRNGAAGAIFSTSRSRSF